MLLFLEKILKKFKTKRKHRDIPSQRFHAPEPKSRSIPRELYQNTKWHASYHTLIAGYYHQKYLVKSFSFFTPASSSREVLVVTLAAVNTHLEATVDKSSP